MHHPARRGRRGGEGAADAAQTEYERGLVLGRVDGEGAGEGAVAGPECDAYDGLRGRFGEHLADHPVAVPQGEAVREVAQGVRGAGHGGPVADLDGPRGLGGELQPDPDGQGGPLAGVPGQPHGVRRVGAHRPALVQPGDPAQEGLRILPGVLPGSAPCARNPAPPHLLPRSGSALVVHRCAHPSPPIVGHGNSTPTPPSTRAPAPSPRCHRVHPYPARTRIPPPGGAPVPRHAPRSQGGTLRRI